LTIVKSCAMSVIDYISWLNQSFGL
jgi:hypothetical protein